VAQYNVAVFCFADVELYPVDAGIYSSLKRSPGILGGKASRTPMANDLHDYSVPQRGK
jgi:hypothetical protein